MKYGHLFAIAIKPVVSEYTVSFLCGEGGGERGEEERHKISGLFG